jgi:hypothetical protein
MLYPIVLTLMCFVIVSILLAYVVPKVVQVFENSHAQLPFMTRVLVALSDFIRHYVFPGGMLPSLQRFREEAERAGLKVAGVFSFGKDYATLATSKAGTSPLNIDLGKYGLSGSWRSRRS